MKVLLVNALYYPHELGGTEKVVRSLAEGLAARNIEIVVVTTAAQTAVDQVDGVKVYRVASKNLYWSFDKSPQNLFLKSCWHLIDIYNPFMARAVAKIIDQERPNLVHTHNLQGFSVAVWKTVKRRGLPLVHTIHDHYLLCPRNSMFRRGGNCAELCWSCALFSRPKRSFSTLVDHVVGVSRFVLNRHGEARYFRGSEASVIRNYAPPVQEPARSSSRGKVRFGFLGKLGLYKGIDHLLQVFASLEPGSATLEVAGTGKPDYVRSLRQKYEGAQVHFLGFVPARELFNQIDVLIVPSLCHEALGLVVLEAYASGTPVIAARRGGILEVVEEGKTGFLFEPNEAGNLLGHILRFLDHPELAAEMAGACQVKAEEFSLSHFIQKYLSVYRGLLA